MIDFNYYIKSILSYVRKKRVIFSSSSLLIVVLLFIYIISKHTQDFSKILQLSANQIIILFLLNILQVFLSSLSDYFIFLSLNVKINFFELISYPYILSFLNYLPMKAGLVFQGTYLKLKYNLSYSNYVASLGIKTVLLLFLSGAGGIILSILYFLKYNYFSSIIFLIFCGFLFICITILLLPDFFKRDPHNQVLKRIYKLSRGWKKLKTNRYLIIQVLFFTFLFFILQSSILFFCAKYLNYDFPFLFILILIFGINVIRFVSIIPGALGIREGIFVSFGKLLRLNTTNIFITATLDRLFKMIITFTFGSIFLIILILSNQNILGSNFKKLIFNKSDDFNKYDM